MQNLTLDQFRTAKETGGLLSVSLIAQGGSFHVQVETRRGQAVLVKARGGALREFRNPSRAMLLLREFGIREMRLDTSQWAPEQADLGKATRPDRAVIMQDAYEAADLKRTLEARIKEADDPNTVWIDHDQLFDELEARYAD